MFDGNRTPFSTSPKLSRAGHEGPQIRSTSSASVSANADQMISQPDVTAHYIASGRRLDSDSHAGQTAGAPTALPSMRSRPASSISGSAPPGELAGMTKRIPAGYIGTVLHRG